MDERTATWADIKALAQKAEEVGFDSCGSLLAALAAVTSRVELGTLVLCNGFRNPAMLAKMADTIDEISGGRLILGLGAGYHDPEYHALGLFRWDLLPGAGV